MGKFNLVFQYATDDNDGLKNPYVVRLTLLNELVLTFGVITATVTLSVL